MSSVCDFSCDCSDPISSRRSPLSNGIPSCGDHCQKPPPRKPPPPRPITYVLSPPDSELSMIGSGEFCNPDGNRVMRYREGIGPSFAAHLLRRSQPMIAHRLSQKFKFKRDSDPIIPKTGSEASRELTARVVRKPSFFDGMSEDGAGIPNDGSVYCPPIFRKGVFKREVLNPERVHRGLHYLQLRNTPHRPPPTPIKLKKEIKETCARISHSPKLKGREQCKRLCEVPSMTNELDHLFQEYVQRCTGDEQHEAEACRLLHHAPHPEHRQRRSILKEHHDDEEVHVIHHHRDRKPGGRSKVQFDKNVDNLSTITKIKGLSEALNLNPERMKFMPQLKTKNLENEWLRGSEFFEERIPPHLKAGQEESRRMECMRGKHADADDNKAENKRARQELARLYFTNEATRLMACSNLTAWETRLQSPVPTAPKPPKLQHFFMHKLMEDMENEKRQKEHAKIQRLKSEMDWYDELVQNQAPIDACSSVAKFDPYEMHPTERSIMLMEKKMDALKRQREREVRATGNRYRCRKVYFRRLVPSKSVIEEDLVEYTDELVLKQSGTEKIFTGEIGQIPHMDEFQNYCKEFDFAKMSHRKESMKAAREVINVLLDNVMKEVVCVGGNEPLRIFETEWREEDFAAIEDLKCPDFIEAEAKRNKIAWDILNILIDVAVIACEYREEYGTLPPIYLCRQWRNEKFYLLELECSECTKTSRKDVKFCEGIVDMLIDIAIRFCEYREHNGEDPTDVLCHDWRTVIFKSVADPECEQHMVHSTFDTRDSIGHDILDVLIDVAIKVSEYRTEIGEDPEPDVMLMWRTEKFSELYFDLSTCTEMDDSKKHEKLCRDILGLLADVAVTASEYKDETGEDAPDEKLLAWRNDLFQDLYSELECPEDTDGSSKRDKIGMDIADLLVDVAVQASEFKEAKNQDPPEMLRFVWRTEKFAELYYGLEATWKEGAKITPAQFMEMLNVNDGVCLTI